MPLNPFIVKVCRELRRSQTPEEKLLWRLLRNRRLGHLKFLRQHPFVIGGTRSRPAFYVVDFYCAERRLVVEVDGKIHEKQKNEDRDRENVLRELNLRVLRIKNEELLNTSAVLKKILQFANACSNSPPTSLRSVTPSLLRREGDGG